MDTTKDTDGEEILRPGGKEDTELRKLLGIYGVQDLHELRCSYVPFQCKCGNRHNNESDFCSPCLRGE